MTQKKTERKCNLCYFGRTDMTDLGTNDYWCGYYFILNSKECKKRFKFIDIFKGYKIKEKK